MFWNWHQTACVARAARHARNAHTPPISGRNCANFSHPPAMIAGSSEALGFGRSQPGSQVPMQQRLAGTADLALDSAGIRSADLAMKSVVKSWAISRTWRPAPLGQSEPDAVLTENGTRGSFGPFGPLRPFLTESPAHRFIGVMSEGILAGKTGVVLGVANRRSIAWAVAQAWADAGASLIMSYQGERLRDNIEELAATLPGKTPVAPCDVSSDESVEEFFVAVSKHTRKIDFLLHSIAYAPREALEGRFADTSRDAFLTAHNISVYSLIAVTKAAMPYMTDGGSVITMSFYGAQKVFPNYNVMGVAKASLEATVRYLAYDLGPVGVRVNAISAGPVQTLAARGIGDFGEILRHYGQYAPMRRSCQPDEIGATAVFLASPGSAAMTGQTVFIDGGYEILGMT